MPLKRYQVRLSPSHVETIQAHLKELGLPKSTLSALIDDHLLRFGPVLAEMVKRKQSGQPISMEELLSLLLAQMSEALKS